MRERALQLARTGTHLTIADGLRIHPTLAMRAAGVPVQTLQQGASALLVEGFPEAARGIETKATIAGQIILSGSVRSVEEKLAISQRMLHLNGCTSVVNQLKVTPILKDGMSLTMVTADGLHVVPTEVVMDTPGEGTAQEMPAVHVISSAQSTGTVHATRVPPTAPMPAQMLNPMESQPMMRPLPSAPAAAKEKASNKGRNGITQGVVTFTE